MTPVILQLVEQLRREPDRVALRVLTPAASPAGRTISEEPVTLRAWFGHARATAERLAAAGVAPGDRVLISLPPSLDFLGAFFGAQWLGAVPVPLPSMAGLMRAKVYLKRVKGVARDAAPKAMIADQRTAKVLEQHGLSTAIMTPPDEPAASDDDCHHPAGDHPAFIQYTSGSTGRPKGVVVTNDNLSSNVAGSVKAAQFNADDRFLSWLPVYHDLGLIGGIIVPTTQQAVAHLLPPESFPLDPASWLHAITKYRATVIMAPNFAYSLVGRRVRDEDLEGIDLSSVRLAFNGAEPVDVPTADTFINRMRGHGFAKEAYYPVYGLAETTLSATFPPVGRGLRVDHVRRDDMAARRRLEPEERGGPGIISSVSVGAAFEGHVVEIRDPETQRPLPERHIGEIVLSGPSVSPCYFDRDKVAEPRTELRSGDLGYLADGELYVVDRLKDLVIIAGACYSPSDIEQVVESVPGVRMGRSVAMATRTGDTGTDALAIVAEVRLGWSRRARDLERDIRRAVSDEIGLVAEEVVLLQPRTLALTSSGKLMRGDARNRFASDQFTGDTALPPYHPRSVVRTAKQLVPRALAASPRLRSIWGRFTSSR